jgi:hypothetical protein
VVGSIWAMAGSVTMRWKLDSVREPAPDVNALSKSCTTGYRKNIRK